MICGMFNTLWILKEKFGLRDILSKSNGIVGRFNAVSSEEVSFEDVCVKKNAACPVLLWGCTDMLFACVFWPRQVYQTSRTHLSLLSALQLSLLQSTLGTKKKKVSVLEEGLWLFWPLKATLGISSRFIACTKFWQRMCVTVQVLCVMMTEQTFAVSPPHGDVRNVFSHGWAVC